MIIRLLLSSVRGLKERVQFRRCKQLRLPMYGKSASGYMRVKYCVFSIQDITAAIVVAYGYMKPRRKRITDLFNQLFKQNNES